MKELKLITKAMRTVTLPLTEEEHEYVKTHLEKTGMKKGQLYRKAILSYIKAREKEHGKG